MPVEPSQVTADLASEPRQTPYAHAYAVPTLCSSAQHLERPHHFCTARLRNKISRHRLLSSGGAGRRFCSGAHGSGSVKAIPRSTRSIELGSGAWQWRHRGADRSQGQRLCRHGRLAHEGAVVRVVDGEEWAAL